MLLKLAESEQQLLFFVLAFLNCTCLLLNSCSVYGYKEVFKNLTSLTKSSFCYKYKILSRHIRVARWCSG